MPNRTRSGPSHSSTSYALKIIMCHFSWTTARSVQLLSVFKLEWEAAPLLVSVHIWRPDTRAHTHTQHIVIKPSERQKVQWSQCGCLSSNGFLSFCCALYFILQVASWVPTLPLAQAPVLVRKPSSSHTQMSANMHTHSHTYMAPTHPLGAIKCMTNTNPNPSGDFVHDVLKLVVVEFIWECLLSAWAVTHPACVHL